MTEGLYEGRHFRCVSNSESGETSSDTVFHYHQVANVVWATYQGGDVACGTLIATVSDTDDLDMRYQQINRRHCFRSGNCRTRPEVLPDGRLMLHESWQWDTGECGTSSLLEFRNTSTAT